MLSFKEHNSKEKVRHLHQVIKAFDDLPKCYRSEFTSMAFELIIKAMKVAMYEQAQVIGQVKTHKK